MVEISGIAEAIARNITQAVFANAQANQKTPEQILRDDLEACHRPDELYGVWRVRQVIESLGFSIYACSEFPPSIRERLGMNADVPAAAAIELNAILLSTWNISRMAVDQLGLHPQAVTTACLLHEAGHLLSAKEPITNQIEKERRAWEIGRILLERHNLYGFCPDHAFKAVEAACRNSYGDPAIVHRQTISDKTYPSLL